MFEDSLTPYARRSVSFSYCLFALTVPFLLNESCMRKRAVASQCEGGLDCRYTRNRYFHSFSLSTNAVGGYRARSMWCLAALTSNSFLRPALTLTNGRHTQKRRRDSSQRVSLLWYREVDGVLRLMIRHTQTDVSFGNEMLR